MLGDRGIWVNHNYAKIAKIEQCLNFSHIQYTNMYQIIQATCQDGRLILNGQLNPQLEGKNVQVILVESETTHQQKEKFFSFVDRHCFDLPDDYQFNREELYRD